MGAATVQQIDLRLAALSRRLALPHAKDKDRLRERVDLLLDQRLEFGEGVSECTTAPERFSSLS